MARNKKQDNLTGQLSFEDYSRGGSMYYAMRGRRKTAAGKNGSSGRKGG